MTNRPWPSCDLWIKCAVRHPSLSCCPRLPPISVHVAARWASRRHPHQSPKKILRDLNWFKPGSHQKKQNMKKMTWNHNSSQLLNNPKHLWSPWHYVTLAQHRPHTWPGWESSMFSAISSRETAPISAHHLAAASTYSSKHSSWHILTLWGGSQTNLLTHQQFHETYGVLNEFK